MSFSPFPDYKFKSILDISTDFLNEKEIKLLLLDLDNTVSPYKTQSPEKAITEWVEGMKKADIRLFIVSNNRGSRPKIFAEALGINYIGNAKKPFTAGIMRAIEISGFEKKHTALAGDQVYTDVLAANGAGIRSILVEPIKFTNFLLAVRYALERPFRRVKKRSDI